MKDQEKTALMTQSSPPRIDGPDVGRMKIFRVAYVILINKAEAAALNSRGND